MSAEITDRGSAQGGYATTRTIAAFTPNADRLLLCWVCMGNSSATSVSGITGHGTWEIIGTQEDAGDLVVELWGCITSGSPSSATVVVTHSGSASLVIAFEASANYSDTTVGASIVQSAHDSGYVGSGGPFTISPTLSAFADATNNLAVLCAGSFGSGTPTAFTEQGSLTQDHETTGSQENAHISSAVGEDLTPGVSSTDNFTYNAGIAVEIAFQGGAAGTNVIIIVPTGPPLS